MSNAIEHFSRTRVENTTLQVIADTQRNLDCLIREEESVIRHYSRLGTWPHSSVNMFVVENLQPLVAQIKSAAPLSSVVADDIDRRPDGQHLRCGRSGGMHSLREPACPREGRHLE